MKKITFTLLIAFISMFTSCEFHQSVNKDFTTGASSRGDGLSCDDVLIQINGIKENRNEFSFGEEVVLVFNNIEGLTAENNLKYPGLSMFIIEDNGDTLIAENDLLSSIENGTDLSPLQLQANFRAVMPHQNNEQYKTVIKIWDKKGDGTFSYELPFIITPDKLLEFNSSGISYVNIYLWNNTKKVPVTKEEIDRNDEIILLFNGVEGLTETDQIVYPRLSLQLIDQNGKEILSSENLFNEIEESGIKKENLANQIPITITFNNGIIVNPVKITAILSDSNSDKKLEVTGNLTIK
ncbi:MAG: hypothetical protein HRT73_03425 [Flavobacteriales bacterium]|nr:hypothetical protein [Flavobacteriales bacterium]